LDGVSLRIAGAGSTGIEWRWGGGGMLRCRPILTANGIIAHIFYIGKVDVKVLTANLIPGPIALKSPSLSTSKGGLGVGFSGEQGFG
jgi:hypothetical protein